MTPFTRKPRALLAAERRAAKLKQALRSARGRLANAKAKRLRRLGRAQGFSFYGSNLTRNKASRALAASVRSGVRAAERLKRDDFR